MLLPGWELEAMAQLALAGMLGAVVGVEREYHGRAAGFRTHLLVSVGCCLVMIISVQFGRIYPEMYADEHNVLRIDPARLAYSVMGGIGFLGAGAIIKAGVGVRGLTTAASLWCIAAVGMAVGFGLYVISLFATGLVMFALLVLNVLESRLRAHWYKTLSVICVDAPGEIERVESLLEENGARVLDVAFERAPADDTVRITYDLRLSNRRRTHHLYRVLSKLPDIRGIKIE